jgi:hypothetical protein
MYFFVLFFSVFPFRKNVLHEKLEDIAMEHGRQTSLSCFSHFMLLPSASTKKELQKNNPFSKVKVGFAINDVISKSVALCIHRAIYSTPPFNFF